MSLWKNWTNVRSIILRKTEKRLLLQPVHSLFKRFTYLNCFIINSIFQSPRLGENGMLVCTVWIEQNYDQSSSAEVEQLSANCRHIPFERERRFSSWKQYNIVLFISLSYINSLKNSISFRVSSFVHYFVLRIINGMAKPYSTII